MKSLLVLFLVALTTFPAMADFELSIYRNVVERYNIKIDKKSQTASVVWNHKNQRIRNTAIPASSAIYLKKILVKNFKSLKRENATGCRNVVTIKLKKNSRFVCIERLEKAKKHALAKVLRSLRYVTDQRTFSNKARSLARKQ